MAASNSDARARSAPGPGPGRSRLWRPPGAAPAHGGAHAGALRQAGGGAEPGPPAHGHAAKGRCGAPPPLHLLRMPAPARLGRSRTAARSAPSTLWSSAHCPFPQSPTCPPPLPGSCAEGVEVLYTPGLWVPLVCIQASAAGREHGQAVKLTAPGQSCWGESCCPRAHAIRTQTQSEVSPPCLHVCLVGRPV